MKLAFLALFHHVLMCVQSNKDEHQRNIPFFRQVFLFSLTVTHVLLSILSYCLLVPSASLLTQFFEDHTLSLAVHELIHSTVEMVNYRCLFVYVRLTSQL